MFFFFFFLSRPTDRKSLSRYHYQATDVGHAPADSPRPLPTVLRVKHTCHVSSFMISFFRRSSSSVGCTVNRKLSLGWSKANYTLDDQWLLIFRWPWVPHTGSFFFPKRAPDLNLTRMLAAWPSQKRCRHHNHRLLLAKDNQPEPVTQADHIHDHYSTSASKSGCNEDLNKVISPKLPVPVHVM